MRAIILAAGAGTRLSPLTNGCPKCLVPVGDKALADYQVRALRAVGVEDIVLVVGCEAGQIRRHYGEAVRYIENPDYLTTNSIYSLYLARGELDGDIFLFNCDILFHPEMLHRMLAAEFPNLLAVDSHSERQAGEMNVAIDQEGRVRAIGKELDPGAAQSQSVQLVKFDGAGAALVRAEVERLVLMRKMDGFPTAAYGPLIESGLLRAVEGGDLPWTEVDSMEDYEHALKTVLPYLEGL